MDILLLLVFISVVFLAGSLLCFARTVHDREYDASEHSSLLPLQDDHHVKDAS